MHSGLIEAMQSYGLSPQKDIIPGRWTRFPGIGKKRGNTAGYVYLFADGLGAVFGDFSTGLREVWQAEKVSHYTPSERDEYLKIIEAAQKRAAEEQEKEYRQAALRARSEIESFPAADNSHPYLQRKQVNAYGLRQTKDLLVMPVIDSNGEISTYQTISPDGAKKMMYGGRMKGCAGVIPGDLRAVCICEGYATGATIHQATGYMVIIAVSSGNILPVATEAVKKYSNIIICADNDEAGIKSGEAASKELGIPYIYPEGCDGTDFNDLAVEQGLSAVSEVLLRGRMIRPYKKAKAASEYPDEVLNPPGLLKDIADYYSATAIRPQPLFGIAAGLAIGSVVLGRRYRTQYKNYTSLYIIIAAKSGTGKDHVKQVCREIMKSGGVEWMERGEGFTAANTVIKALEGQPLQISFFEEIGLRLQEAANNPRSGARGTFRKLLDIFSSCHSFSVSEEYADRSVHRVDRPSLTMVGLTTPRALSGAITESLIEQGFVNRILPFISHEDRRSAPLNSQDDTISVPESISSWIRSTWMEGNLSEAGVPVCPGEKDEVLIEFTPEAIETLNAIDGEIIVLANELEKYSLDDMLSRNREIAMRVALIAAVMDGAGQVDTSYVKWAWGLVRALYARYIEEIRRNVSGSEYERGKLEALAALRQASEQGVRPADMPKTRPWSKWSAKIRGEILQELQSSGLADKIRVKTGKRGPKSEVWIALE